MSASAQIDVTKRTVTLDSIKSRNVSKHVWVPDTINSVQYLLNGVPITDLFTMDYNGSRPITRTSFPTNLNTGATTVSEFLDAVFFPSTSPTATITNTGYGTSKEFTTSGTDAVTLTWTVTRPAYCTQLALVVVDGTTITPTPNPAEGASSGATTASTITKNTNKTFTVSVTSADGKTGSASTTVTWYWKRYWGAFASAVPPTNGSFSISDAQILALTGAGVGTGNEISTTRVKSYDGINGGGDYLVFAFPSSWGTPLFVVNGLPNTAFTKVRDNSFTNASGGSTTYQVWVSNFEQNSAISDFEIL